MKQDDMEKEKKKCSGTYLEDSHPDIYPESVKEESGYYVATKKTFYSKTFNIMNGKTGLPKLYSLWLLLSAFSLSKFLY